MVQGPTYNRRSAADTSWWGFESPRLLIQVLHSQHYTSKHMSYKTATTTYGGGKMRMLQSLHFGIRVLLG